ncbi:MAG TPA: proton-conducting transporter membrane subunit, partial [Patescibacteria group bacterium]|nr:proton-conducting transporter membrane subunit [Patescibacteria group bacterium]
GPARFYAMVSGMLFGVAGALVSLDLVELIAFWGIAGIMSYLMLAHRWGSDEAARASRIALALPFVTDLSFLCGVAWLHARYGLHRIDTLLPILHTTAGWTVRAIVVGSVLLFIGAAGRLAIVPLHSWITGSLLTAPPAASAIAQSAWPVLAVVVLYRVMPIFAASNLTTVRACMYVCAAAAVAAPVMALFGNEPRRVIALLGSGAVAAGAAVLIHSYEDIHFAYAAAGIAAVLAAAPARAAATLLGSVVTGAMKTDDMADMGEGWVRLRSTSLALLLAGLALAFSALSGLVFGVSDRSWLGVALGEAVLLIAVGALRVFLAVAFGPLRRRRAFEPERVREDALPSGAFAWPLVLGVLGAAMLIASLVKGWLDFLDGYKHPAPAGASYAVWVGVVVVGLAIAVAAYVRDKDGALRASALAGAWAAAATVASRAWIDRFFVAPLMDLTFRVESGLEAGDGSIGRLAGESGRLALAASRAPAIALALLAAVALAVIAAFFAPGVLR